MKQTAKTIGELIDIAFRKSQMTVEEFTKQIGYTRGNFYKIIKKNTLDIQLLKKISEVLNHNFFEDISKDLNLANTMETEEEIATREAMSIFTEIVPKVLSKMHIDNAMFYWRWDGDKTNPTPDWGLCAYAIGFTIGQKMEKRYNIVPNHLWVNKLTTPEGVEIEQFVNNINNYKYLNITICKRTEEEWKRLLDFAINYAKQNGYRYNTTHQYF
ncbi:MAG: hypothetical protein J6T96_13000 [Bacteroidales bacterium]|nr:hypothetical protein [Bacteroidales bacterium]MBO7463505.1 hypothetical protein [Bacteroidales bacterium]